MKKVGRAAESIKEKKRQLIKSKEKRKQTRREECLQSFLEEVVLCKT